MTYTEKYDYLTDNYIATEEEIDLVVRINGATEEQLENILFVRTGYTSFESYNHYEVEVYEWDDDDELDDDILIHDDDIEMGFDMYSGCYSYDC